MPETELGEVEGANEAVDRPNRIVRTDIVLDPRRKQTGLLAALAALERAIRHKPNRTCCSRKCPQFLPSLDVSNTFAASKASCRRPPATLHGVVFHISVGSANRLDLAAQVVANGKSGQPGRFEEDGEGSAAVGKGGSLTASWAALSPHPCVTAPPLSLEEPAQQASRRMGRGPHGSPGDAKYRPETAQERLLTMRATARSTPRFKYPRRCPGPRQRCAPSCWSR